MCAGHLARAEFAFMLVLSANTKQNKVHVRLRARRLGDRPVVLKAADCFKFPMAPKELQVNSLISFLRSGAR